VIVEGLRISDHRPTIPDGPQTIPAVLDRVLAADPDREALVGRHARYTYAQLDEAADRAAAALVALGIRPGDRVAASLANHPDVVVAFLGTMRAGAVWVGINRPLAPKEKAYMLRDAGVAVLLADTDGGAQVEPVRAELPDLRHVVITEAADPGCQWQRLLGAADPAGRPTVDTDPFGPAAIAYTSGTTGFPKGAVHSQHNLLLVGAVNRATGDPALRHGVALPLTVLNLVVLGPLAVFQLGATCVTMDRVDALGMAEWIRDERIGTFAAVPVMLYDLLTHPDVRAEDLVTLVRPGVGGSNCPAELRALYRERFGAEVVDGYGLTEAPTAVAIDGVALPQVRIVIRDDAGAAVPDGEVGEICVEAARTGTWAGVYTPFLGYWNRPDATADALRDGVLHTGDLGCIDDGRLVVKDRKADLIIRGGANVYPAEVERVLHLDPRVAACAVVGHPDERLGERVVAFVQLAPEASATADELRAGCIDELARYKVPAEVHFVDGFVRNAMGKIVKTTPLE
jgi:long-chain acyl-CoA synthetase